MFIIKRLSQHVLGIIMTIIRRTRPCTTAYGVLQAVVVWSWVVSCVLCVKVHNTNYVTFVIIFTLEKFWAIFFFYSLTILVILYL